MIPSVKKVTITVNTNGDTITATLTNIRGHNGPVIYIDNEKLKTPLDIMECQAFIESCIFNNKYIILTNISCEFTPNIIVLENLPSYSSFISRKYFKRMYFGKNIIIYLKDIDNQFLSIEQQTSFRALLMFFKLRLDLDITIYHNHQTYAYDIFIHPIISFMFDLSPYFKQFICTNLKQMIVKDRSTVFGTDIVEFGAEFVIIKS
jgi:hypothetical protein